jgi:hypothetical protein
MKINKYKTLILFAVIFSLRLNAQNILHTEVLGKPTNNSISIKCFFDTTVQIRAEYGTISGTYTNQTLWFTYNSSQAAEVVINNLSANTKYYYRIHYKLLNASNFITRPEYTFTTQRNVGNSFTFVVQADPHMDEQSDTALYSLALKNELEDNPDFMVDLGDFLMTDKLKNTLTNSIPHDTIPYRCKLLRKHYEKSCHSMPLFIALGNHEGESGWNLNGTANNIAVWDAIERKKYFSNPAPNNFYTGDTSNIQYIGQRENYYAWQWGDAEFIVLDPYWYTNPKPDSLHGWRWTLGKTQYEWLKKTLENSTAKFKFVFAHQIIGGDPDGRGGVEFADRYEWGGNNLDGTNGWAANRPGWYKPIKDLLTEHHVNIFFHGHDHFFGKQEKDCLIYQESPQPSHPNFQNVNYAAAYGYVAGQILPQSGHIRISVAPTGVKVDYVRAYLPQNENATRHNKDISATYFIGAVNCYDSMATGIPVLYNRDYANEVVYPNPFMDKTKIDFDVKNDAEFYLSIYDLQGIEVRKLLNYDFINKGKYQIIWDGKSSHGGDLPDGTYIYKLNSKKGTASSGRIILKRN